MFQTQLEDQPSREVAALRTVQFVPELCATEGQSGEFNQDGMPSDGDSESGGALQVAERRNAHGLNRLGNAKEDRCRGDTLRAHPEEQDGESTSEQEGICQTEGSGIKGGYKSFESESGSLGCDSKGIQLPGGAAGANEVTSVRGGKGQSVRREQYQHQHQRKSSRISPWLTAQRRIEATFDSVGGKESDGYGNADVALTTELCLDECDGVWEVACSPHSWLSQACEAQGLRPRRINLQTGFDLYRPECWEELKKLRAKHRPRKLWFSLPCTKFCQWTQVNYSTPERQEQLRGYQRKERKVLWNVNDFVKDTLEKDETVDIYFEWTHPCKGWAEAPMQDLEHHLQKIGHEWLPCRVDGCNYGLRDKKLLCSQEVADQNHR